jgi:hypothetical protein
VAGWWCTLVTWVLLYISYFWFIALERSHSAWYQGVWGPDVDWKFIGRAGLLAFVAFKLLAFMLFISSLWLTLWARGLRRTAPEEKAPETRPVGTRVTPALQS